MIFSLSIVCLFEYIVQYVLCTQNNAPAYSLCPWLDDAIEQSPIVGTIRELGVC